MFKNYLLTFLRSSLRNKSHALVNIIGLTIGLASSIFILIWVREEYTFDRMYPEGARIFEVLENQTYGQNKIYTFAATPGLLGPALKEEIPEVQYACRTDWGTTMPFAYSDKIINQSGRFADSTFFDIFQPAILYGDATSPLPDKHAFSVSRTFANKYFDEPSEALGKVFLANGKYDLTVTSVYEDMPRNSSLRPDYIVPFEITLEENEWMQNWGNNGIRTYVKLDDAGQGPSVSEKIADFAKKRSEGSVVTLFLYPFESDHLYGNFVEGRPEGGRIKILRLLGIVALFILLIACINFMNLVTARALNRIKEVGLRKVIGASRRGLILQFIFESMLLSLLGMVLALAAVRLLMPAFNLLTSKDIVINFLDPTFILPVMGLTIFVGLMAGSYPALLLSSFKPASALKRNTGTKLQGDRLRKALVIFQFSLSVILVLCTVTIYDQINYIRRNSMGFDRENVVDITLTEAIAKQRDAFKTEAEKSSAVAAVAFSSHSPLQVGSSTSDVEWPGKDPDDKILVQVMSVSAGFVPLMGIEVLEGRNFVVENRADTANYLVNEEAVKRFGLKDPVGADLTVWETKGKIIGVIHNFNSNSLHNPYEPLLLQLRPENASNIMVKFAKGKETAGLGAIEKMYNEMDPSHPFEYQFLDTQVENMYRGDIVFGKLANSFTVIAILISCLGLFGLSSYAAQKRTKEIGVRKVLGASVSGLILMLCTDFTWLVLIAFVLGSPVAYWLMNKMLENYAFHVGISFTYFIAAGLGLLFIALLTVIFQSARAAMSNPVDTLRTE